MMIAMKVTKFFEVSKKYGISHTISNFNPK